MEFVVYITYKGKSGEFSIDAPSYYDALMKGSSEFLKKYPENRPHDDRRRPYPIPLKPSFLVNGGFAKARRREDRRIKY